jgi:DNA-directed RNA polymerase beta subunit
MAIQEGIPKEGDDSKLVNYAYWLCDLQVTDDEALCNALYRPVQAFGSEKEFKDNIKGQNDGKGQSYHIRRMDPSGTIGSIIESENEAETILGYWENTNWKEWKLNTIYDKVFSVDEEVQFYYNNKWNNGTISARFVGKSLEKKTETDYDFCIEKKKNFEKKIEKKPCSNDELTKLKLNDMRNPPTFDIKDENNLVIMKCLQGSIVEANKFITQESCMRYVTSNVMYTPMNMDKETGARKKQEFAQEVLNTDLFPHCKTMTQKIYFLGYMTNCLLRASLGLEEPDDRDSYLNKRVDSTGVLLNNLFRNYFNKMIKDMQKQVIKEINTGSWRSTEDYQSIINMTNVYKIVKSTTIENGLKRALATGDFGVKHFNSNKVGVAQVLNRLTYISSLSHLRRINTPIDKSGKLIPPRKLPEFMGILMPGRNT